MGEKVDNIYIYLWEELNTIYIGRTINPKGRHDAHKHGKNEKTYQFSSEHGVEHPKMIIIENDLTIDEGVEREKYWINYYRENSPYEVLNKSRGGQIGQQKTKKTEEEKKQRRREYNKEYREKNRDKISVQRKRYRKENREEYLTQRKKYREENREKILAYKKKYREKHREELRIKAKEYQRMLRESKK